MIVFLIYAGLFKLKIEVDVFLHQDVDRHIFYGCDRLFEYHVIAQRFNAAIALQSRPLPDEIVHFTVFQVFHILLKQVVADQCIQLQILFLQVVRHLIHA